MYKYTISLYFLFIIALTGCTSVNQISFDQLQPAEVSFPEQIHKVAIIYTKPTHPVVKTNVLPNTELTVDTQKAKEFLANRIADARYFDKVIVGDSAVQCDMDTLNFSYLSNGLVSSVLDDLDSDMIISLDEINISLAKMSGEPMGYPFDLIRCITKPEIKFYVEKRKAPIFVVAKSDTVYFNVTALVDFDEIKKEVTEEALVKSVNIVLPYWENVSRYYYTGGSYEMRDAEVAINNNDWEGAFSLWNRVYEKKKGKLKNAAAFNIGVYHEMKDNIPQALKWLDNISDNAKKDSSFNKIITPYKEVLLKRQSDLGKLKIQMRRFNLNN